MGQFRKALFIINPNSGRKKIQGLEKSIQSFCAQKEVVFEIQETQHPGHATDIAKNAVTANVDLVVAVGGDGTVNETAKGLLHSNTTLGILPKGSGNGLARHLGISLKPERALQQLVEGKIMRMDSVLVNDQVSVNVSGIGFDGHIANLFGSGGQRGLREYVSLSAAEFRKFKNFPVKGIIDGEEFQSEAFILAIANSSQFGNNATVSPTASICDGAMDICVIRKVSLLHALGFVGKMFTRRMHKSAFAKIIKCRKAEFSFQTNMPYHVDGEGKSTAQSFTFKVVPASLNILTPSEIV